MGFLRIYFRLNQSTSWLHQALPRIARFVRRLILVRLGGVDFLRLSCPRKRVKNPQVGTYCSKIKNSVLRHRSSDFNINVRHFNRTWRISYHTLTSRCWQRHLTATIMENVDSKRKPSETLNEEEVVSTIVERKSCSSGPQRKVVPTYRQPVH